MGSEEEWVARIRALERENRVLTAKLGRSEQARQELEAGRDKRELLLREVIRELRAAEEAARAANEALEGRVAARTRELSTINEALALARDEAVAATAAKSRFLANMSHELRTPLNAIIGYAELLAEEVGPDGGALVVGSVGDLERIVGAARHLLALISDVLDLSKIEAGQVEVAVEALVLEDLVTEVVATVTPLMRANHNRLRVEVEVAVPLVSDGVKVRQILFNLLSNSAKFTEDGTIWLRARSLAGADGGVGVEFAVEDTGIGISERDQERLFTAFMQADDSSTRLYGGTGLGLAITRSFCELLGGQVTVYSRLGEGSRFTVRLPSRAAGGAARESAG